MPFLFSYGTLREPATQLAVFGRVVTDSPDEILGFARRMVEVRDVSFSAANGSIHAVVQPTGNDEDRTVGSVLEVSDAELNLADAYEPPGYRRVEARFASGRSGWVYAQDSGRALE